MGAQFIPADELHSEHTADYVIFSLSHDGTTSLNLLHARLLLG